jgi:hypothetical protein
MIHLGIDCQSDLAKLLGCNKSHLCRWLTLDAPPSRFCKGFDAALCGALKIDRATLLRKWRHIAPEVAPRVEAESVRSLDPQLLRRQTLAIVELLEPEGLQQLYEKGRALLATASAA